MDSNHSLATISDIYSPVMLSEYWPKVGRLMLLVIFSTISSILNGFFVASFFVEQSLRRIGLVFLGCAGLTDLFITAGVMPISSVVLLSGEWNNTQVCNAQQFITMSATYCYSLFFMFVAAEDYFRLCCSQSAYDYFISCNVVLITVFTFGLSFALGGVGVYMGLDYDYCNRMHGGDTQYRIITTVLFHVIPSIITLFCLISSYIGVRRRFNEQVSYRRSLVYARDHSLAGLNILAYCLYFTAWIPYMIISFDLTTVSNATYYNSIWVGVARSMLTSLFYGVLNQNFRSAFAYLFNYCCCKSSISGPLANRHRRECRYGTGDVRVHIMHQAVSTSSPQRGTSCVRETYEL